MATKVPHIPDRFRGDKSYLAISHIISHSYKRNVLYQMASTLLLAVGKLGPFVFAGITEFCHFPDLPTMSSGEMPRVRNTESTGSINKTGKLYTWIPYTCVIQNSFQAKRF